LSRSTRLEDEVGRWRIENKNLRGSLEAARSEVTDLRAEIVGQKNKLKGAGKKVQESERKGGRRQKTEEKQRAPSTISNKESYWSVG
jgi:predicted  nucleic acid-binding Zn-ribbon protein